MASKQDGLSGVEPLSDAQLERILSDWDDPDSGLLMATGERVRCRAFAAAVRARLSSVPAPLAVPGEVVEAATRAEDLLAFHEGSEEYKGNGSGALVVWINADDYGEILEDARRIKGWILSLPAAHATPAEHECASLECPCCGRKAVFATYFQDGQETTCGCGGIVSADGEEAYISLDECINPKCIEDAAPEAQEPAK